MARILYMSQGYSTHDRRFLREIAAAGHQVWLLPFENQAYESRPVPEHVVQLPPLTGTSKAPWRWLRARRAFRNHLKTIKPDLIHAGPIQSSAFVAAWAGFHPLLAMSWGSDILTVGMRTRLLRFITRYTLARADLFFADCQAVKTKVQGLAAFRPDQFIVFPWGVDTTVFQPRPSQLGLRQALGWETARILLHTRGFEPIHDPMVFLRAIEPVMHQHSDVRAVMLGRGSLRADAERFIAERHLGSRIHLAGQVQHTTVPDYFNESDLYVSTTLSDGSSISLLEAMACRRAVIVTEGYGNAEWVVPGKNGWLYPAGDVSALSAAILDALQDDARRKTMGVANRELVERRADWAENIGTLLNAYDRLLGRTPPPVAQPMATVKL